MAQRGPAIPEEQLLDLIRNPKTGDLNQRQVRQRVFRFFSFGALKARIAFFLERAKRIAIGKERVPSLSIRDVNRILKITSVVLAVVLGIHLTFSAVSLNRIPEFEVDIARTSIVTPDGILSMKKISYYLERARSRDIFKFGTDARQVVETTPPPLERPLDVEAPRFLDSLALVGIGFSEDPDVMIKNVETGKIYFLKRGDWIETEAKVEAIFVNKVILSSGGQEIELR